MSAYPWNGTFLSPRSRLRFWTSTMDLEKGFNLNMSCPGYSPTRTGIRPRTALAIHLGVKWRFLDEDRHGVSMSIYPQIAFNTSNTSVDKGLVDKGTAVILPFQLERKFGPLNINGEVGYIVNQERKNQWIYGLAFGYRTSEQIEWVGEFFGGASSNFEWDRNDLVFNLGFRWKLNQWLNLNTSAGRSLHSVAGNEKTLLIYTGLQFVF